MVDQPIDLVEPGIEAEIEVVKDGVDDGGVVHGRLGNTLLPVAEISSELAKFRYSEIPQKAENLNPSPVRSFQI